MRPVHYVPESKPVDDLMREMQRDQTHVAATTTGHHHEADIIATGVPPGSNFESALVVDTCRPMIGYTAVVRGADNGTGIGVVEVYDLDRGTDSKMANISTRGVVQTGDNTLIGGLLCSTKTHARIVRLWACRFPSPEGCRIRP